jgi:hypothetical protein
MKRSIQLLHRSLSAAALLGALAFGATQAFAAPEQNVAAKGPYCDPVECNARCGGYGVCQAPWGCLCW